MSKLELNINRNSNKVSGAIRAHEIFEINQKIFSILKINLNWLESLDLKPSGLI